jgi:hypothetical protein
MILTDEQNQSLRRLRAYAKEIYFDHDHAIVKLQAMPAELIKTPR